MATGYLMSLCGFIFCFDLSVQTPDSKLKASTSMSKLRASIMNSGIRFVQKLTSPHGSASTEQSPVDR